MRTITRLCLVASITAAVGLAAVPVGHAAKLPGAVNIKGISSHHNDEKQNNKINKAQRRANKAHRRIQDLKEWNFTLQEWNSNQQSAIESLQSTVSAIVAGVPTITSALTQLQAGLVALQAALTGPVEDALGNIADALNNPTTGLVGLNAARPQFGAFAGNGTFIDGTGPVNGADPPFGPTANATQGPSGPPVDADGVFVIDFENDVSERVYSVNVAPTGPVAAPLPSAGAVNCASPGAGALCGLVINGPGGAAVTDPNLVAVQFGNGTAGGPTTAFTVTAFSG